MFDFISMMQIKFHIQSHQKLSRCGTRPDISSLYHLNMEQLMKCLLSLLNIYDINRISNSISKNEAEFYSFYVLLHLGCKIPTMVILWLIWSFKYAVDKIKLKKKKILESHVLYNPSCTGKITLRVVSPAPFISSSFKGNAIL